ncbi:MAG: hypothetical protein ACOCUF_03855 [Patescibacteria group bacterium]
MNYAVIKKKKVWGVLLSVVGILTLLIVFVVIPLKDKVYSQKDQMIKTRLEVEEKRKEIGRIDKYEKDLEYINKNKNMLDGFFLEEGGEVDLIEELEEMADKLNLNIKIESSSEEKKKKNELYFDIDLKGSFEDYMEYVYKLENFRLLSRVEELKVEKISKDRSETEVKNENEITGSVKVIFLNQ